MSSTDASANIPNLPTEMWLQVLQYLGPDDLESFRLTCRHFFAMYDRFLHDGDIFFYGNINTNAEIMSLANREHKAWNLEFVDVHLTDDSILSFFHTRGASVYSLAFRDCKVVSGLLRNIILCCENLCVFRFEVDCSLQTQEDLKPVYKDFGTLRKDGIVRQYVSSFALRLRMDLNVTDESFSNFFAIFPNIEELDLACHIIDEEGTLSGLSFSIVYDQLSEMRHRLVKLRLHLRGSPDWYGLWNTLAHIEMEKLKELSVNWNYTIYGTLPDRLPAHLTEFECVISPEVLQYLHGSTFFRDLLSSSRRLRSLTVLKSPGFQESFADFNDGCFRALAGSQLKTIYLDIFSSENLSDFYLEKYVRPNYILKNVRFGGLMPRDWGSLLQLFTKYFHCLEVINVISNHEKVMHNIVKYQRNLRNLKFCYYHSNCSTFLKWLSHNDGLGRTLDNLTCLSLLDSSTSNLCEQFLTTFRLPKLKSLAIVIKENYCSQVNGDRIQLLLSIRKLSELEYLEIHWKIGKTALCLFSLYENLPKLHYLIYSNNCYVPFSQSEYDCVFKQCSTLRIFMHKVDNYTYHRYVNKFKPGEKIDCEVVSLRSIHSSESSPSSTKLIYEGIPRKYLPYYWNNEECQSKCGY